MDLRQEMQVRQYVIQDLIAEGGMGAVWRAWDSRREVSVAIKVVSNDLLADPDFKTRFLDEVHRHARLNHPNIVPVLDAFEHEGQSYCVMQLIEGTSLAALLKSKAAHRLEGDEARRIMSDILAALDYAHQHGIIHRDIKPSNVLLDREGRAYLIDFGIALAIGEQRRTRTGLAVGTPLYMSPEQIRRPKEIDHRSDVYSAGCVFYEMLTGRPPFLPTPETRGDTDFAVKEAHVKAAPIPPRALVADIPPRISRLIMMALEKNPANRLPGCREFLRLLNAPETGERGLARVSEALSALAGNGLKLLKPTFMVLLCLVVFVLVYGLILAKSSR